jgi:hypothetical protein
MRKVETHIIELFKERDTWTFGEIYRTLRERGMKHYQTELSDGLKYFIKNGNLVKLNGDTTHPRYQLLKSVIEDAQKLEQIEHSEDPEEEDE